MKSQHIHKSHNKTLLLYHIVFPAKYRRKVFDSSVERGEPAVFGVTQVIKGWQEVLQLMTVGSKYKAFIPSDLAYGDRGAGEDIKPGATLIFEIELLEIVAK